MRGANDHMIPGWVAALAISPSGSYLAYGLGCGIVEVAATGQRKKTCALEQRRGGIGCITFIDDHEIASGATDGTVTLSRSPDRWATAQETSRWKTRHKFGVKIAPIPNSRELLVASLDRKEISIWQLNSRALIKELKGLKSGITDISVSHDGRYVSGTTLSDGTFCGRLTAAKLSEA